MKELRSRLGALVTGLLVTASVHQPLSHDGASPGDKSVLAGEWEYEDGAVVVLQLDDTGNGTYPYKDGRFETSRLDGHTWVGKWYQGKTIGRGLYGDPLRGLHEG